MTLAGCIAGDDTEDVAPGPELVAAHCSGCHPPQAAGGYQRINDVRKTPEAWMMTLFRMSNVHGVELSQGVYQAMIRYLADTQGLAPEETEGLRFILERRPNVLDISIDEQMDVMCGRCHTNARYALQRRNAGEWLMHVHMHVGLWPSLEYQATARDRPWWQIATEELPQKLESLYPLETPEWDAWRGHATPGLDGEWVVVGRQPGKGSYRGTATIAVRDNGKFDARYRLTYDEGVRVEGESVAIVYTGFEWRGRGELGGEETREVFAVSPDGNTIQGRWFEADASEVGGEWLAVRAGSEPQILAVTPSYLRAGQGNTVTITGMGLEGQVSLGEGVTAEVLERDRFQMTVRAVVTADAGVGYRDLHVGSVRLTDAIAVFRAIDSVRVEPDYAISRVGGGRAPPVAAQFEAIGYLNGPDRVSGTDDDIRLGVMPAQWTVEPYDEIAASMEDDKFAGGFADAGLFVPGVAGPNPARKYSTNNTGNLWVLSTVADVDRTLTGRAHMIVTVQRWNDPPIR